MHDERFDDLARSLAHGVSRREALRKIGGTLLGAALASLVPGTTEAAPGGGGGGPSPGRCGLPGQPCKFNSQCCPGTVCLNGSCACGFGSTLCQGQCLSNCPNGQIRNPNTCDCEFPDGSRPNFSNDPNNCGTCGSVCDDNNVCTTNTCVNGGCVHISIAGCCTGDAQCNDNTICTTDTCDQATNTCIHTPIVGCCSSDGQCNDNNPCTTDTCDLATNTYVFTPIAGCCTSDAQCNDNNPCTTDTCVNNQCVHTPITGGPIITCGVGACRRSVQTCVNGVQQTCTPGQPSQEVCNGIDDDCDGVVDEGAICPGSQQCQSGRCCVPSGQACVSGVPCCAGTCNFLGLC